MFRHFSVGHLQALYKYSYNFITYVISHLRLKVVYNELHIYDISKLKFNSFFFQNESVACSCLDCSASCPGAGLSPLPYEPEEEFLIFGFYGLGFIMCLVYPVLALMFVAVLIILWKVKCAFFRLCDIFI
jgi:hypothetical protein